jgi:hypothetical protein
MSISDSGVFEEREKVQDAFYKFDRVSASGIRKLDWAGEPTRSEMFQSHIMETDEKVTKMKNYVESLNGCKESDPNKITKMQKMTRKVLGWCLEISKISKTTNGVDSEESEEEEEQQDNVSAPVREPTTDTTVSEKRSRDEGDVAADEKMGAAVPVATEKTDVAIPVTDLSFSPDADDVLLKIVVLNRVHDPPREEQMVFECRKIDSTIHGKDSEGKAYYKANFETKRISGSSGALDHALNRAHKSTTNDYPWLTAACLHGDEIIMEFDTYYDNESIIDQTILLGWNKHKQPNGRAKRVIRTHRHKSAEFHISTFSVISITFAPNKTEAGAGKRERSQPSNPKRAKF